jgi:hypothetical protein
MVFSRVDGKPSADLTKLSGHAYMSGADSWVDLERMLGEYCAMHHVRWFGVCQSVISVRSCFCFLKVLCGTSATLRCNRTSYALMERPCFG